MTEHLFSLNNSVESFLTNLIDFCNEERNPKVREQIFSLFDLFCEVGFDFYSLLAFYSQLHSLTTYELEEIALRSPMPQAVMLPETKNIRKAILGGLERNTTPPLLQMSSLRYARKYFFANRGYIATTAI